MPSSSATNVRIASPTGSVVDLDRRTVPGEIPGEGTREFAGDCEIAHRPQVSHDIAGSGRGWFSATVRAPCEPCIAAAECESDRVQPRRPA